MIVGMRRNPKRLALGQYITQATMNPANRARIQSCTLLHFASQGFQHEFAGYVRHGANGHTVGNTPRFLRQQLKVPVGAA